MSVRLIVAPAGAGKTAWALDRAREAALRLEGQALFCVASRLQARACRRRLAEGAALGAVGVRVLTFDDLARACLDAAGRTYCELDEAVQHRLIRTVLLETPLPYYGRLAAAPGLVRALQGLLSECAAAGVPPALLEQALAALPGGPRLSELAEIHHAYRDYLNLLGSVDRDGLVPLASEAVAVAPREAFGWSLLVVDGLDTLAPARSALLSALALRLPEVIVTLTGDDGGATPLVWRRHHRTQEELELALGVRAEPLPGAPRERTPVLAHLERGLRGAASNAVPAEGRIDLLEAPDRAGEAREALRWLKERIVRDGMRPGDVALIARSMEVYRPYVVQVAAEMGLPLRVVGGLPLSGVPVVAALLDLLRLALPIGGGSVGPALPRRLVVEAWRSPYVDWRALLSDGAVPPGDGPSIAARLDEVARWGRVVGGWAQWDEAFTRLAARSPGAGDDGGDAVDLVEEAPPARAPVGEEARLLRALLERFVARLSPPAEARTFRDHVAWLEGLIGADAEVADASGADAGLVVRVRGEAVGGRAGGVADAGVADAGVAVDAAAATRDIEALRALKDVLRGLVVAEALLPERPGTAGGGAVDLPRFYAELTGALDAARLTMPAPADRDEIVAVDVATAVGVPFRAVALLGLSEGEFPAPLGEDVLLRDADRRALRERGVSFELPTESMEPERFYMAVTRASERLLLSRSRLADNGAAWAASPFWEEVRRLVVVEPRALTSESVPRPEDAASWPELIASLAAHPYDEDASALARRIQPVRWESFASAAELLRARGAHGAAGAYDGDLRLLADTLGGRYGPHHIWSATRLEQYRACPFMFLVGSALGLEPRAEPVEGLDARQLGSIYHRLFEAYYRDGGADSADADPASWAAREAGMILDAAPERDGFRETAWWPHTRAEIVRNLLRSLAGLAECSTDCTDIRCEQPFGGETPLVVRDGEDTLRVRGFIDRVDRYADGSIRIVDYKTAGPADFTDKAVSTGKKLQLPLYALAARDALGFGEPRDGFYWHVQNAERSRFSLSGFDGGPEAAYAAATAAAWEVVRAVRHGAFAPAPPHGGCPSYCPAAAFCWAYRPGYAL